MAEIGKLSETHHQMLLWLLENPGKTLRDMSEHFNYSVPWLSQVINSNIFQARLKELQNSSEICVIADIPAKLRGLTSMALDVVSQHVDDAAKDPSSLIHREYVKTVAELGLKSLGLHNAPPLSAASLTLNQQNNTYVTVAPEVLARAREKLMKGQDAVPDASQLHAGGESDLRTVQPSSPALLESPREERKVPAGDFV
jgi:hypothetical protein